MCNKYCESQQKYSAGWFNLKMSYYQYRKSHCGDKTTLRPSYFHNGSSYTGKMASLYWIGALACCHYVMTWTHFLRYWLIVPNHQLILGKDLVLQFGKLFVIRVIKSLTKQSTDQCKEIPMWGHSNVYMDGSILMWWDCNVYIDGFVQGCSISIANIGDTAVLH